MKVKFFTLMIMAFISLACNAGGDYWYVKVNTYISSKEPVTFDLTVLENTPRDVIEHCKVITVMLDYENIPFWSWFPYSPSSPRPTQRETLKALDVMNAAFKSNSKIYFGYMSGGLAREKNDRCSFKSKGLRLKSADRSQQPVVFSFFEPMW